MVTTASEAHRGASFDRSRIQDVEGLSGMRVYSLSKLANILFAAGLARRLEAAGRAVVSRSLHPGSLFQLIGVVPGTSSVGDGAAEILYVALADEAGADSGRYFSGPQPASAAPDARDGDAARRLLRRSADLLGIDEPLPAAADDARRRPS